MTILEIFLNPLIDQKSRYISLNEGSEQEEWQDHREVFSHREPKGFHEGFFVAQAPIEPDSQPQAISRRNEHRRNFKNPMRQQAQDHFEKAFARPENRDHDSNQLRIRENKKNRHNAEKETEKNNQESFCGVVREDEQE